MTREKDQPGKKMKKNPRNYDKVKHHERQKYQLEKKRKPPKLSQGKSNMKARKTTLERKIPKLWQGKAP